MKIPYGVADFYALRTEDNLYVDRTDRIGIVEDLGKSLLFLRPRRFGKSLWLSTLANYYDLRLAGEHERLFGDLAVGREPTPLAHRFFVLRWDFSKINPDPPRWGVNANVDSRHERISNEINGYLNTTLTVFQRDYGKHLPEILQLGDDPFHNLEQLLSVIRGTPYRLYLLIDEYDNFANEVLTDDADAYHDLVRSDGPFKYLFKWVKGLKAGAGLERLFITGVSPLVMSDVTSGMNIAENVYLYPELNSLCGFTEEDVEDLLKKLDTETAVHPPRSPQGDTSGRPARRGSSWTIRDALAMMRDWYNGYRFALGVEETIYNPTLVFHFLKHFQRTGAAPRQMLDSNLAADEGKLEYLARLASGREATGQDTVIDLIRKEEPLEILHLHDRFTLKELLERSALGSYLFYFGMLTLKKEETEHQTLLLEVPNEVVHGLYVERIRKILMPLGASRSSAYASGPARQAVDRQRSILPGSRNG